MENKFQVACVRIEDTVGPHPKSYYLEFLLHTFPNQRPQYHHISTQKIAIMWCADSPRC